jgi:hypothetical protein
MSTEDKWASGATEDRRGPGDESGIIVFGGGCRGCGQGMSLLDSGQHRFERESDHPRQPHLLAVLGLGSWGWRLRSRTCHRFVARRPAVETEGEQPG